MNAEDVLRDLAERIADAAIRLDELAKEAERAGRFVDHARLDAKRQGVLLAWGYADEALRAVSA